MRYAGKRMARTVSVSRTEYQRLRQIARRFELLRRLVEFDTFAKPPVRNVNQVMRKFRETERYSEPFLKSLEHGLRESSYFLG